VLNGDVKTDEKELNQRDALGLTDINSFTMESLSQDAEVLIMEVPMVIK
jgi:hypothetical protein